MLSLASAHTAAFDLGKARTFAGWAAIAYCDNLEGWNCGAQCRQSERALENVTVITDNQTQGQAFVAYDRISSTIIISFRGTVLEDFDNWWSDLDSLQLVQTEMCPVQSCQVGKGFLNAYNALQHRVFAALYSLKGCFPYARVSITGHSLGASLAHLCVLDCHARGIRVDDEITFGSPRTGNKAFGEYFATISGPRWRITHDQDPIPHLPPYGTPLLFWHTSTEVFFPNQNGFVHQVCTEGKGEDKNCCMAVTPLPSTRDHVHYLGWGLGSPFCLP